MTKNTTPLEDVEQKKLVKWLVQNDLPHFHVNNEMWTKSNKQKKRAKEMGVSSGVPDLFIQIPLDGGWWIDSSDPFDFGDSEGYAFRLVVIEMKRQKGGVTSKNQKRWLEILNASGIEATVCEGADNAIKWLTERLPERIVIEDGEIF